MSFYIFLVYIHPPTISTFFSKDTPNTFCCDLGAREDASWIIQNINVPSGWGKTGLLPFDAISGRVDDRSLLYHRPNNYFAREEGYHGHSMDDVNNAFMQLVKPQVVR